MQFHLLGLNQQPLYIDSSILPLGTALLSGVVIQMKVWDYRFDIGVKGLRQIYLIFIDMSSFIFDRECPFKAQRLLKIGTLKWMYLENQYDLYIKGQGQRYVESVLLLATWTAVFFDRGAMNWMTYIYYQITWLLMPPLLLFRWRIFIYATLTVWGM